MKRLPGILCLLMLLATGLAHAQNSPPLLLRTGTVYPASNVESFIQGPNPRGKAIAEGKYVRILQFTHILTDAERLEIERTGLELMDYLPKYSYLTAFPERYDRTQLLNLGVRSVIKLDATSNMQPELFSGNWPDWIIRGDKLEVTLTYFEHVSANTFLGQLAAAGYEVTHHNAFSRYVHALIPNGDLGKLATWGSIQFIEPIPAPAVPDDVRGRGIHRSNAIDNEFSTGRHYDGSGVSVVVNDDGYVGPHIDFQGRTEQSNVANDFTGTHGDMVAGILGGAGNLDPTMKGMASGSFLWIRQYSSALPNTVSLHTNDTVLVFSSSYSNGCNSGYTNLTNQVDQEIHTYPTLLQVFSAGNSNNNDCGYGAGNQWGNITGGHKQGKNVIATANLAYDAVLQNSSSRGPAHDGRIKPDISAHGAGQMSTDPNNSYAAGGGTSAAAPGISGVVAQLHQAHRELNSGQTAESPLIKAVLLNTAHDLGNAGPDFKFGWGRVNAFRAAQTLENQHYLSATISQGGLNSHTIQVPAGTEQVKIMVYWLDPAGSVSTSQALVNDLNMTTVSPGGTTHLPWLLDHTPNATTLDLPATQGVDSINNVEQVVIDNPAAGNYFVTVSGHAVPSGPQKYYVVYDFWQDEVTVTYPMGGEGWVPGESERIHWDANEASGTFDIEYTVDNGNTWQNIVSGLPSETRAYDWTVPTEWSGEARIRVSRGSTQDESDENFTIGVLPTNLEIAQVCSSHTLLTWDSVPGAIAYDVFMLGNRYMDSVGTSTTPYFQVNGTNSQAENWFAVRAIGPNGIRTRRTIAVNSTPGVVNCNANPDLSIKQLTSPGSLEQECFPTIPVEFSFQNISVSAVGSITLGYQVNGGPIQTGSFTGTLSPGISQSHVFSIPINNPGIGTHTFKVWVASPTDTDPTNDTLSTNFQVSGNTISSFPYTENFDTYNSCSTNFDCGATLCPLGNGWLQRTNGVVDDIDFRVTTNSTPSSDTGPTGDHTSGNGNFLYTEASNGCNFTVAELVSPCIDFSNSIAPVASIWYHMWGDDMGSLHIDLFDGNDWILDIVPPKTGNQGNNWQEWQIPLNAYVGGPVNLRIRAITGSGYQSDIAIDDFSITETVQGAIAAFTVDKTQGCVGQDFSFNDQSQYSPNSWNWTITPNTFIFVNGTSATDPDPQVQFTAAGTYDVSLTVNNGIGPNTLTQNQLVTVQTGIALPLVEDAESGVFPPVGWQVENPDASTGWTTASSVGSAGLFTQAFWMNNISYSNVGQTDALISPVLDLTTSSFPILTFDVSHPLHGPGGTEELRVWVSTDCGETFSQMVYQETSPDLATVGVQGSIWFPSTANDWRNDTIDLSAFAGSQILVKFEQLHLGGHNVFLDNINLDNLNIVQPVASFQTSNPSYCEGDTVWFTGTATGNFLSQYDWDFGANAVPATATGPGPHAVLYAGTIASASLTVANPAGTDFIAQSVSFQSLPVAGFTTQSLPEEAYFFQNSSSDATAFQWDFGNGDTSLQASPNYEYTQNGSYVVTLIASNDCGIDTFTQTVDVTGIVVPQADFLLSDTVICAGDSLQIIDQTLGIQVDYAWTFNNGNPGTGQQAGPLWVTFTQPGMTQIQLIAQNGAGADTAIQWVEVLDLPSSAFNYQAVGSGLDLQFTTNDPSLISWSWDFGDGNSSTLQNPLHSYAQSGLYTVKLTTQNNCGMDSTATEVSVTALSLDGALEAFDLIIAPNPTQGNSWLTVSSEEMGALEVEIFDPAGKALWSHQAMKVSTEYQLQLDASAWAQGIYLVRVQLADQVVLRKWMKR
ncbi:PKD domain-containing protein [Pontibacter sp. G13]|uniref:PKD domain-containing protein n=1 Tax=Pontibacter sp. G13 TaxID=3074898 RepID=UPI00288A1842|nr:PKD domain-containing protein [Pontibacter sp. G13]WNJ19150.1 PKD domain-containing protein [Pontibacter sp. G13]